MAIDRDFVVRYVNQATMDLLRRNAEAFQELWPGFDPETIVGTNIDLFHKNPAHQRQLLSDPSRLPHRTDISVGDQKFALAVNAVFDAEQNYVGNVLEWDDVGEQRVNSGMIAALHRSQAMIEFDLEGRVQHANELFLQVLGYELDEIVGRHHSMFVAPEQRETSDYRQFWDRLGRGEFESGKYRRIAKSGEDVWIQASYNPVLDQNGRPFKIIEFASDVTEAERQTKASAADRKRRAEELSGVVDALAEGLKKLGAGDLSDRIIEPFPEAYEKLRADYNAALETQRDNEEERAQRAEDVANVVEALADGLNKLAEGDLTARVETAFPEEYERLRNDYNSAMARLQDAMRVILDNAGGIDTGSREISQAADDLSRRTEQQAASLEETAAALDQITATVKRTAEGAAEADTVGKATRSEAESGGEIVSKAVSAMGEIESSAEQISRIIGVIDEIAFQTNLLALNAGVEAARAGDAGRGFAVVASEVRALAQRSSDAAKEIKSLILASAEHVASGVDLVGRTGAALDVIVDKVARMSGLVGEIAASAEEQATGLSEVNTAVNQMDRVTQQNAAMVEQTSAASHSLVTEAGTLTDLVGKFQIGLKTHAPSVSDQQLKIADFANSQTSQTHRDHETTAPLRLQKTGTDDDWTEF